MRKSEMKRAARDRWRVQDDFGALGKVVALADDSDEHLMVHWDHEREPHPVHHDRATWVPADTPA